MTRDCHGLSVIVGAAEISAAQRAELAAKIDRMNLNGKQGDIAFAEGEQRMIKQSQALILSGVIGTVLGVVLGALLWKKHRVAGALIGGLIVGPSVGFGTGWVVATSMRKK